MKVLLTMTALVLACVLLLYGGILVEPAVAARQPLQGESARTFLAQEGILAQLGRLQPAAAAVAPPQGRAFQEPLAVTVTDAAAEDRSGYAVATDGETVVVGALTANVSGNESQGAAYVFGRDANGNWIQKQKLAASDGKAGDFFGLSVAVDGETIVVGADEADIAGTGDQGAAYVFRYDDGLWQQEQKLVAADGGDNHRFGGAVAVDGDTVVVGAHLADAAYVFVRSGASWTQQAKLVASDGVALDGFGGAVAVAGDTAIVGARSAAIGTNEDQGAAYIFRRSNGSWSEEQKLTAFDGAAGDDFGISVDVAGETAIVGAWTADVWGNETQGAAYVFAHASGLWSQQQKLLAPVWTAGERFGRSVALDGDTALVGAPYTDVGGAMDQGVAYTFIRDATTWSYQQTLLAAEALPGALFGNAVALGGDTAVLGAPQATLGSLFLTGQSYVAERGPVPWPQTSSNVANDGAALDGFGGAVAVDGDTAIIGASNAGVEGKAGQGAAYIFNRNGPIWVLQQKLTMGSESDGFGFSVALDEDTAVVGAWYADVSGRENQGKAYVFTRVGASWLWQQTLMASDGVASDHFGAAVAVDGDRVVVGAPGADLGGNDNQGAAYLFGRSEGVWSQQQKLVDVEGEPGDRFGQAVAVDGDVVVVGAPVQRAAYAFVRDGQGWVLQQKLAASDFRAYSFGQSVALSGETLMVGAPDADVGRGEGAAYLFTRTGSTWTEQEALQAADGGADDAFGLSVDVQGETAIVGAYGAAVAGKQGQGAAYLFSHSAAGWSWQQKLLAHDGDAGDYLGYAVSLDGDTALAGAFGVDVDANDEQGRVYFFKRERLAQSILFPEPQPGPAGYVVGARLLLAATADSGLPVSFRSETPAVCTVVGAEAALLATGDCTLTAYQPGDASYLPAESSQRITVMPRTVYLPLTVR